MRAYPLTAVVGMDDLVLALLLAAVAPEIGGVLVRGEKGTAKSTAVRALAALLPPVDVVPGCRFACDPKQPDPGCPDGPHTGGTDDRPARLVELPVGATEDRLLGSLDLERALSAGVRAYEPGLLAAAHRGILYVDEVNLLHDHLVDVLLDAAAMGRAHIEREGISITHASRFVLVGTMNPEEGELRPQLLDRFGLTVEVKASRDPDTRAEVVRRRLAYDADPDGFVTGWQDAERLLSARIAAARELLLTVELPDAVLRQITAVCAAFDVDGMRGDLVVARASRAHAAWCGRDVVNTEDVRVAARFALPHRRRRDPFDAPGIDDERLEQALEDSAPPEPDDPDGAGPDGGGPDGGGPDGGGPDGGGPADGGPDGGGADPNDRGPGGTPDPAADSAGSAPDPAGSNSAPEDANRPGRANGPGQSDRPSAAAGSSSGPGSTEGSAVSAGTPYRVKPLRVPGLGQGASGRRSRAITPVGRTIATRPVSGAADRGSTSARALHLPATLLAAAPHQRARGRSAGGLLLQRADLRVAVREGREGNLVLFCVDASGSMAARKRMTAVKGAVLSLLLDAYQRRDRVGLVTFRGAGAELALPPTGAVEAARARLEALPTGGRTPLAAGLQRARAVIAVERIRDPERRPLLIVVTDGRHTAGDDPARIAAELARSGVRSIVVDCERGPVRLGLAGRLATYLNGDLVTLDDLRAESLANLVRDVEGAPATARTIHQSTNQRRSA
ncbi:MAG TPA: magnesium chelatase subunit D family protein [Kineosporiaceae bacterium]|nr:magnesium chelatase subunit D family protein [Kineosporiaceae bacterium]